MPPTTTSPRGQPTCFSFFAPMSGESHWLVFKETVSGGCRAVKSRPASNQHRRVLLSTLRGQFRTHRNILLVQPVVQFADWSDLSRFAISAVTSCTAPLSGRCYH